MSANDYGKFCTLSPVHRLYIITARARYLRRRPDTLGKGLSMIQGSLQCLCDVVYPASLHHRSMLRKSPCPQSGLGCIGTTVSYPNTIPVLKSSVVASVSLLASEMSPASEHLLFHLSWPSTFGRPSVWFGDLPSFPVCFAPRAERKE